MKTTLTAVQIASICHEANRALCAAQGDYSQMPWQDAPKWQQDSALNGVEYALNNPTVTPQQMHENWGREKEMMGWAYGPEKDSVAKTHPCLVPYDELPAGQQAKDALFSGIVRALGVEDCGACRRSVCGLDTGPC